jgi:hypothetical protein
VPTVSAAFPGVNPALIAAVTSAVWTRDARRLPGGEITFRCVDAEAHANGDAHPSCRWNPAKGVFFCDVCRVSGGTIDLAERLAVAVPRQTIFELRDVVGTVVALHVRVDHPDGSKECIWKRPGGESGLGGAPLEGLPLYGSETLAQLEAGSQLVLVEGEKPRDHLAQRGIASCGTITGAGTIPTDDVLRVLTGFDIVVWCDADAVGRRHMVRIRARLRALAIPCRWLDPWPEKTGGEDAADYTGSDVELRALLAAATEPKEAAGAAVGVLLADVVAEQVRWLWPGRLALGKLAILEGRPDEGKTTIAADLAARTSTGSAMPFETTGMPPSGVVFLTAEDGLADTIRPRLEAAGADLTRIVAAKPEELPTLTDAGLSYIRALAERVHAALIVIDPLMAFVPDATDTYRDHHARRLLRKLSALAEDTGAAVLVLRHVRKGAVVNPKDAGGGSIGFTAAARVVLLAAGDPEDDTRKVLARVKGNLSAPFSSLAYKLQQAGFTVKVDWIGATTHTAEQLLAAPTTAEEISELDEAKVAILDVLAKGPVAAEEAMKRLKRLGIAEKTAKRAKATLRVPSRREGFGGDGSWSWFPPKERHVLPDGTVWDPPGAPPETEQPSENAKGGPAANAVHADTRPPLEPGASPEAKKPWETAKGGQKAKEGHVPNPAPVDPLNDREADGVSKELDGGPETPKSRRRVVL